MKVIITGATGMVGEGVMLECLENPIVTNLLVVNRKPLNWQHEKLSELIVSDFMKLENYEGQLSGYDGCFFCAGVSSVGMSEAQYTQITYNTTLAFATKLAQLNPTLVFTYVSGASTDSSEKGKLMWARVKGKTENDLMKLSFKGVYNFRPGVMKPLKGQKNLKTLYKIFIPIFTVLLASKTLTLKQVGQAMINVVRNGYSKHVLEISDIRELSK